MALVALFCAIAFFLMPEPTVSQPTVEQPEPEPTPVVVAPPVAEQLPKPTIDAGAPELPIDAGAPEPSLELTPIKDEPLLSEAQVAPAVAEVRRIVRQCYADVEKRYPPPVTLTLSFELKADGARGALMKPVVDKSSIQDPFFEACVQDAPLDVQVTMTAVGSAHVRLPFRYSRTGE